MSDDEEDSGIEDWVIKAIVIGAIVGALYWFFSPQLRCERTYLEKYVDSDEMRAVIYCQKMNSW